MTIIFDLGRVVVSWDPVGIVSSVRGPQGAEQLAEQLFNHPDWLEVDRGTMSLHTMAREAQARTGLSAAENLAILQAVPASLLPDPAMLTLIAELHGAGTPCMPSPTWATPASTGWSSIRISGAASAARWYRRGCE